MKYNLGIRYTQKQFLSEFKKQYPEGTKDQVRQHWVNYKLMRFTSGLVPYEKINS